MADRGPRLPGLHGQRGPGAGLIAALPVMTTCGEHGLRLQTEVAVRLAALDPDPDPEPPPPVPEPVIAMDRLTWEGVTAGRVTLPGRAVHIGVWLRLLRTLLDEGQHGRQPGQRPVCRYLR